MCTKLTKNVEKSAGRAVSWGLRVLMNHKSYIPPPTPLLPPLSAILNSWEIRHQSHWDGVCKPAGDFGHVRFELGWGVFVPLGFTGSSPASLHQPLGWLTVPTKGWACEVGRSERPCLDTDSLAWIQDPLLGDRERDLLNLRRVPQPFPPGHVGIPSSTHKFKISMIIKGPTVCMCACACTRAYEIQ